jgi:DnaD/phage-associated family protein
MKRFEGFPGRSEFTPLPNAFFSDVLPRITDISELKVTLYIMAMLYRKKDYPRFVTYSELLNNTGLVNGLKGIGESTEATLRDALEMSFDRGTLLHLSAAGEEGTEDIYFLNDDAGRQAVAKIGNGELKLTGLKVKLPEFTGPEEASDIFALYEQNIGMLTPMIADELKEIEKLYPVNWIAGAFKEAVLYNKRNIRYISKILENWVAEGRSDGTHQRHPKKTDSDRFIKGKYGHMVQH